MIKVILIFLAITRKFLYNSFYKEEVNISNSKIFYAMKQNLKLIEMYRKENKKYLNHKLDYDQKRNFNDSMKVLKQVAFKSY